MSALEQPLDGPVIEVVAKADAPKPGAIVWLLLRVKSREGAGKEARMRYSAVYEFYAAGE